MGRGDVSLEFSNQVRREVLVHQQSWNLAIINVLGGVAVLVSYVHGLQSPHARDGALWGSVPAFWRSWYGVSMIAAAIGYFPFTWYFLRHFDPQNSRFAGGLGYSAVTAFYLLVLLPSALWLPLTVRYLAAPSGFLWAAIRLDLMLVAVGSIGLAVAASTVTPSSSTSVWRVAALLGLVFFCLQTVVLDALVWPVFFPQHGE